ncbi:PilZ domain-containing protein [uncultured Sphingomonas sp.]|uniref:PilZ domain-containing protein n=1 Tax=uncultured Sphingomonas sp. TaxID=158754 RepID=UPI0025F5C201|nr:PilZ domain-containing protein [uncultured Sphingomonas sp.]
MSTISDEGNDPRGARRRSTRAASTIRITGAGPIDVMVLDVSSTGVRILTPEPLDIGQEISIGLAGAGLTRAFVAWAEGEQYGCAFEAPIAQDVASRAFSKTAVVRLGQRQAAAQAAGSSDLRDLYHGHSFWQIPSDAILATILMIGLAVYLGWTLIGG